MAETIGSFDARQVLAPDLLALNRLPARAPLVGHGGAKAAESARTGADSKSRISLDGKWNFRLLDRPEQLPAHWPERVSTMARAWNTVDVPGCWTRQRVGDWPHYTNIVMPWAGLEAPDTPESNPTGLYHRLVEVPAKFLSHDVVLHLGGFESVAAVWCNGTFVGMGKDSRLPSEFDVTEMIVEGRNSIDIMVIRYSDATWIEDQDHWWHAGLHRSVFLEARASDRIDDLFATADFDAETGSGSLHVDGLVCGRGDFTLRTSVYDGDKLVVSGDADVPSIPDGAPIEQLKAA